MSSMRNAVQRRSHRERAQPLERKRLGLLEKHKDYSLRAKDWNKKQTVLKNLRQKAAERNEDEFSYKMLSRKGPGSALTTGTDEKRNRRWMGTVNGDRGNKSLSIETVRFLKTQDAGYLRTMRNVQAKEVRQLEERVAVAKSFVGDVGGADDDDDDDDDEKVKPKRIVFAETAADRDEAMEEEEEGNDEDSGDDDEEEVDDEDDEARKARHAQSTKIKQAERLQRRLVKARRRLKALTDAETQLDLQRARMAKTATVDMVQKKTGKRIKVRTRKR